VEPAPAFTARYRERAPEVGGWLRSFDGPAVRAWVEALGLPTFVGSSGKVFPTTMKAAPLLRAWLARLATQGVGLHLRHRWLGWSPEGGLRFATPEGEAVIDAAATVLALGGGSWSRLGSDGAWCELLAGVGVAVAPLKPANCGFEIDWSPYFRERFAGEPLKAVRLEFADADGRRVAQAGECLVTRAGLQGPLVYALSAPLRNAVAAGPVEIRLDLIPDRSEDEVRQRLSRPRGSKTVSAHWQRCLGIKGVKAALLREGMAGEELDDPAKVAHRFKSLRLMVTRPRPMDESISTAGGVMFDALDPALMLSRRPGVFCAGEMLDWEAPTGGYLLTACLASGRVAAQGVIRWLNADARSE